MVDNRAATVQVLAERLKNLTDAQQERHATLNRRFDTLEDKVTTNLVSREEFNDLKNSVVTKTEFGPVKRIAFGIAGITLATVLAAFLALVIVKGQVP